ncbi:MAG: hypothetical protein M3N46_11875, partial [Actinomycetota bacterium]|nr:hypothetical protein [Actinomycetota bacterium]
MHASALVPVAVISLVVTLSLAGCAPSPDQIDTQACKDYGDVMGGMDLSDSSTSAVGAATLIESQVAPEAANDLQADLAYVGHTIALSPLTAASDPQLIPAVNRIIARCSA